MLVVGGAAVWLASTKPVHEDAAAVPSTAAAAPSERYAGPVEESRRLARALVAGDNLPGLSVAVAVDGEIVWAEGFGWADVESRTPVTPLTRFRLGALSKPMTAVAAALLHDRGRLDLDAPVQRYVPAYPQKQWTVTTRQLMGDVAGVHRIRGDNNDAHARPALREPRRGGRALRRRPAHVRAGHASTATRSTAGFWSARWSRGRPGSRLLASWSARCSSRSAWTRTVVAEPRASTTRRSYTPRSICGPGSASRRRAAGLLLSGGRRRFSLHADGPRATRLCDAEARAAEGGDDRRLPDAHAPRRLERPRPTRSVGRSAASSSRASRHGWSAIGEARGAVPSRS